MFIKIVNTIVNTQEILYLEYNNSAIWVFFKTQQHPVCINAIRDEFDKCLKKLNEIHAQ